jgi:hypothetical protein
VTITLELLPNKFIAVGEILKVNFASSRNPMRKIITGGRTEMLWPSILGGTGTRILHRAIPLG